MVTISDVARECKVATSTVSRVLNDPTSNTASRITRELIQETARRMGYKINLHAKSLASRSTYILEVWLVMDYKGQVGSADVSLSRSLVGIWSMARSKGYHVAVDFVHPSEPDHPADNLASLPIAGVIVYNPRTGDSKIKYLADQGIPFIVLGSSEYHQYPFVDNDNFTGACIAVEHLIKLGHKNIAYLGGPTNYRPAMNNMLGFRRTMQTHGLAMLDEWITSSDWTWDHGFHQMKSILALDSRHPTAVFAANDMLAIGAMQAIKSSGLAIPDDIAVVGMNNIIESEHVDPPLTTLATRFEEPARRATEKLIEMIENPKTSNIPFQDLIVPQLIIRESCGSLKSPSLRRK